MGKRILIAGNSNSVFIIRLLQNIKSQAGANLDVELYDYRLTPENVNRGEIPYPVHGVQMPSWARKLARTPKLRIFIRMFFECLTLHKLLRKGRYDAINIQELPFYSWLYVACAHRYGTQAILTPIGSDALRVKGWPRLLLKKGFEATDHVTITVGSGFAEKVFSIFNIDQNKVRDLSYGSDAISEILRMKGRYTRTELAQMLNLPYADYYICCAYNAKPAQNHSIIVDSINVNKHLLPASYQILVPLGYGNKDAIRMELEEKNKVWNLNLVFLMDFLTPRETAALRMISDLFIHIQDTDAHCFTMREFLLADTEIVNGSWLSYPELESFGVPYHTCSDKEDLKSVLQKVFSRETPAIACPLPLKEQLQQSSWENVADRWIAFYSSLA